MDTRFPGATLDLTGTGGATLDPTGTGVAILDLTGTGHPHTVGGVLAQRALKECWPCGRSSTDFGMTRWTDPVPDLKRRLADEVLALTDGWSQTWAAAFMDIPQSRVSDLRRGKLDRLSVERLIRCLSRLDRRIEIRTTRAEGLSVHPHARVDRK